MMDYKIELENVSKCYTMGEIKVKALENLTLTINHGEIVVFLGPSGSGKTTLLNLLGGITPPDSNNGHLKIFGDEIQDYKAKKTRKRKRRA